VDADSRTIVVHDARYQDGAGVLLAWDFRVTHDSELATYLFRAPSDSYFVHAVSPDVAPHEAVTLLDVEQAYQLYREMRIRILPDCKAFPR
jgi:hypothetical protein